MKYFFYFILIFLLFFLSGCDKDNKIINNEDEILTVTMPRPKGWLLGTWTATMPEYATFAQKSAFAGKKIKLILNKEHTMNTGYWYEGQLIWDDGSSNAITFNFKSPAETPYTYIQWLYDSEYDIENLYLEIRENNNYIILSTTYLGSKGVAPQTISFDWQININGVYESAYFINQIVFSKK